MEKLREFTGTDFYEYQGIRNLPNGERPLIARGKIATLIVGASASVENEFGIYVIANQDAMIANFIEAFKIYEDVEKAKTDANLFVGLVTDSCLAKDFLSDFDFTVI